MSLKNAGILQLRIEKMCKISYIFLIMVREQLSYSEAEKLYDETVAALGVKYEIKV